MNLHLLNTFRTIADAGSVTRAAGVLLISQPALSRQLRRLEADLGVDLFLRRGRRLELTAAGRKFLEAVDSVLSSVESARKLADSLAAGRLTRVHVAAPTTTLTDVLAPFLSQLQNGDPLITVEEAAYSEAVESLTSGSDLAVVTAPPPRDLRSQRVATLPVWAHVRADHVLARQTEVLVKDLGAHELILLDRSARSRQLVDEALIDAGQAPVRAVECHNPFVAQALAAADRGVAILSDDPRFDLVPLAIRTRRGLLTLTLYATWDASHHAADALEGLAHRLSEFCVARYGDWADADGPGS